MSGANLPTGNAPAVLRLYHGTDVASANGIMANGLDAAAAAALNGQGEFWATTDQQVADWFAQSNPLNGAPARFEFDVPVTVLTALLASQPVKASIYGGSDYEFLPAAFPALNQTMMNRRVVSPVP